MRILIVEDEVKIRAGMSKLIQSHTGHVIVGEAENGEEGVELAVRFKPDLIITDIKMPKMDGLEMMEALERCQIKTHVVILSGYSEFEYAKRAIQFGADDYLLKPIAAEDVQEMLAKVAEKIADENQAVQGRAENIFRKIITGEISDIEDVALAADNTYELITGYIGGAPSDYKGLVQNKVTDLRDKYKQLHIYSMYFENEQRFYIILAGDEEHVELFGQFEQGFYRRLISLYPGDGAVWTKERFETLEQLKGVCNKLSERILDALVLNVEGWLTEEHIGSYQLEPYQYPSELASQVKSAVCSGDGEEIKTSVRLFIEHIKKNRFRAREVKQSFLKLYLTIEDTLHDIDQSTWESLKNSNVQSLIEAAVIWRELESALDDFTEKLTGPKVLREDISNFVIKKAINYIRKHYQEGIRLEEIAAVLNITPEYLSTLFNREMNINFSTFLKQFRLSHAKRMLKGTDKKVYEIAEAVGYSDAKYFARVFKEEEGVSPGEYRQMS